MNQLLRTDLAVPPGPAAGPRYSALAGPAEGTGCPDDCCEPSQSANDATMTATANMHVRIPSLPCEPPR